MIQIYCDTICPLGGIDKNIKKNSEFNPILKTQYLPIDVYLMHVLPRDDTTGLTYIPFLLK